MGKMGPSDAGENEALICDRSVRSRSTAVRSRRSAVSAGTARQSAAGSFVPRRLPRPGAPGEGLTRIGCFFGGVADDYSRRFRHYAGDITSGLHPKTLSSALFMFFATFFSTVALGVLIQDNTDYYIGTEEYLLMNSIAGMAHALFGCQPLLVLRPTGPITAIIQFLYKLRDTFDLDFWQYLSATGFFVGLYMVLVAGLELSRHISKLTRFTHEIFAFFVCSIYIHDGVADVVKKWDTSGDTAEERHAKFGQSLFFLCLALLTFVISMWLGFARSWSTFTPRITEFVSDYAVTIAVFITIGVSYMFSDVTVERVDVPSKVQPTVYLPANDCDPSDPDCVQSRDWLVSFSGAPAKLWPIAAATALPIVFFFYMDQNVSSLYCQLPEMKLSRGSYFHSSFLCMGLFNIVGPSFGLPFVTGSLPHSPQFVKALTEYEADGADDGGRPTERAVGVAENRIAPFIMYLLIGLPVFVPEVLNTIPKAAIDGILTYVGVAGLLDTQLWQRCVALFKAPESFPPAFRAIPWGTVHSWTGLQLLILAVCWGVNLSPAGLLFSVIVVSIVPFRAYCVSWMFSRGLPADQAELVFETLDADHEGHDEPQPAIQIPNAGRACLNASVLDDSQATAV